MPPPARLRPTAAAAGCPGLGHGLPGLDRAGLAVPGVLWSGPDGAVPGVDQAEDFSGARIAEIAEDQLRRVAVLAGLRRLAAVLERIAEDGQRFRLCLPVAVMPAQLGRTQGMRDGLLRPR